DPGNPGESSKTRARTDIRGRAPDPAFTERCIGAPHIAAARPTAGPTCTLCPYCGPGRRQPGFDSIAGRGGGADDSANSTARRHQRSPAFERGVRLRFLGSLGAVLRPRLLPVLDALQVERAAQDRKSTRLNSSHVKISYAV